jgi:hypothetical protein
MLIDGDLARPRLDKLFDIPQPLSESLGDGGND